MVYESYQIKKPIFIIGVPRSGTGLLHQTLCAHPELAWFGVDDLKLWISKEEKEQLKEYFSRLTQQNKKIPRDEHRLAVFGRVDLNPKRFDNLPPNSFPIEGETFWRKYFGDKFIEDIPANKKSDLVKTLSDIIIRQKKSRFLNKAPQNVMRLNAIKKIFPDAIFINIARNPRSVVSSMITRSKKEGSFDIGIPILDIKNYEKLDSIQKRAWQYKEITEVIYDFSIQNTNQFKTVFYEEFLKNPKKFVKDIFDFCNLETPEKFEQLLPKIRPKIKNKWIQNLNKDDVEKIFDITKSSIQKMNYPYKSRNTPNFQQFKNLIQKFHLFF
ncbi:MAG: sulfotransferase [Nitrosopumilus sp.]|nr:sulfotransferase [Nitrosopumilus sp.]